MAISLSKYCKHKFNDFMHFLKYAIFFVWIRSFLYEFSLSLHEVSKYSCKFLDLNLKKILEFS